MTYEEKLKVADTYLLQNANISWNDLPDINSLHDCDDSEEVKHFCNERLEEAGYYNYDNYEDEDEDDEEIEVDEDEDEDKKTLIEE